MATNLSGTYNIIGQQNVCLGFTDANLGTNVSISGCNNSPGQQWTLAAYNTTPGLYTVKNVMSQKYTGINPLPNFLGQPNVGQTDTPLPWYLAVLTQNPVGYGFCTDSSCSLDWNIPTSFDNHLPFLILFPHSQVFAVSNEQFYLIPLSGSPSSAGGVAPTSPSTTAPSPPLTTGDVSPNTPSTTGNSDPSGSTRSSPNKLVFDLELGLGLGLGIPLLIYVILKVLDCLGVVDIRIVRPLPNIGR